MYVTHGICVHRGTHILHICMQMCVSNIDTSIDMYVVRSIYSRYSPHSIVWLHVLIILMYGNRCGTMYIHDSTHCSHITCILCDIYVWCDSIDSSTCTPHHIIFDSSESGSNNVDSPSTILLTISLCTSHRGRSVTYSRWYYVIWERRLQVFHRRW